jgi:hypothetical protein
VTIATEEQKARATAIGARLVETVGEYLAPLLPPGSSQTLADFNLGYMLVDCALLTSSDHRTMVKGIAAALGAYAAQMSLQGGDPEAVFQVVNQGLQEGWAQVLEELSPRGRA